MNQENYNNIDDFNTYLNSRHIVLVYFSADVCNICKILKPKVTDLVKNNHPEVELIYLNTEKNLNLCGQLLIFSIPTIIIFFKGREYVKFSRNVSLKQLDDSLHRLKEIIG